jgi:hypothetical protein
VRRAQVDAETDDGGVVLLGLRVVARAAVQRDQVRVRLRERRLERERGLVRGNGALEIALSRQLHPRWTLARAIVPERVDGGKDGVLQCGPARPVPGVRLERTLRLVAAAERTVGEGERVLRGAPFRKQRDRALQVRDRASWRPLAALMRPSPNSTAGSAAGTPTRASNRRWLSSRSPASRSDSASFTRAGR